MLSRSVVEILTGKPVEYLQQLELIVKVVLEPQDDFLIFSKRSELGISGSKVSPCFLTRLPAAIGDELGADLRHLRKG